MSMRIEETTRGAGKIYMRLVWDEGPKDASVVVHALSKKGKTLPATTVPLREERSCVVVLAVLSIVQRVSIALTDDAGQELNTLNVTVPPLGARIKSSINTLRKNKVAEGIRNIDETPEQNKMYVAFALHIFSDEREHDIVRGSLKILAFDKSEAQGNVEMKFYDGSGKPLDNGVWTTMGDSCGPSPKHTGLIERNIAFSVRVPKTTDTLVCWAMQPSTNTSFIRCLRPFEMQNGREAWREFSESAQVTSRYDEWFTNWHRASALDVAVQARASFAIEPLFSIIVPVFRTDVGFFCEMVESVLAQSYGKFELILVNASPEDVHLTQQITRYACSDERIRVVSLRENLGIVGNTYAGVAEATGDFVSFFDHDDVLEPDILYRYVEGINKYPTTDLLYCDEDKLLEGRYISPFFKPDWSSDLLCSENYVCHMLTVRKSIVDELPKDDLALYEGSQDHHLTLFASERARNIYHARRVLYHWRIHAQSTAASSETKSYTSEAGVRAVQAHLDRCGIAGTARMSNVAPNTYHVDYELASEPLVSIIIPNKDMVPVLSRCIDSVLEHTTYTNYEIVIVENNSVEDETFAYYERVQKQDERIHVVKLPSDGTFNFSRIINFGARHAQGDYLLLLNNDTEVQTPRWLECMAGHLTRPEVGIVGAKLLYPDGLIQHVGVMLHKGTGPFHVAANLSGHTTHYYCSAQLTCNYSAVTGACMLVRRSLFDEVGGFDEALAVDYNDVDFCLHVRETGALVVYEPEAVLTHYESISRGSHQSLAQKLGWCSASSIMLERWKKYYAQGDPYCSPHLTFSAFHRLVDETESLSDTFC